MKLVRVLLVSGVAASLTVALPVRASARASHPLRITMATASQPPLPHVVDLRLAARSSRPKASLKIKGFSGGQFTANLGDKVPLVARSSQLTNGENLVINEVTGKTRTIATCVRSKCSHSAHFDTSGKRDFQAVLTDSSGVVTHSRVVTVRWLDLSLALTPSDPYGTFNSATHTQLAGVAVHLEASTPSGAVGSLWTHVEIVDESGAIKASCGAQSGCSFDALEYAGTRTSPINPVTHSYHAIALGSSGATIVQSVPLAINWRPWVVRLDGGGTLASTDKGDLTVQIEHAVTAPNLALVVVDLNGSASDALECADVECSFEVGPKFGKHTYEALVVNPSTTDVAGASSTVSFQWCIAGMHNGACDQLGVELSSDHDQIPVGGTVTISAESQDPVTGSGAHIVITDDNGGRYDCPADDASCVWAVKETSAVTRTYTAWIELPDGSKAGPDSNTVQVEWKSYFVVSLLPSSQMVTEGKPATLTAMSNLALLPGYSMKLFEDNGNESSACTNEAGSCTWEATESIPGKHTFHAEIFDDRGDRVDTGGDVTAEVEWVAAWRGSIAISVDNSLTGPPVGVKPTIRAIVSGATLNGTGYTIHITSSSGGSWSCPDTSDNCFVNTETSMTVGASRTYHAYVADLQGAHAADSSPDVTITWGAWPVTLQLDPVDVPVPYNGSTFNPSIPFGADSRIVADTGSFNVSGTGLHLVISQSGSSAAPVTSSTSPVFADVFALDQPADVTFEAYVADASNNPLPNNATMVVAFTPWNVRGYWDQATTAANYMVPAGTSASLTATSDFEIAGTGYHMDIFGTSRSTPDLQCTQTTNCIESYTGQAGDAIDPVIVIYSPQNMELDSQQAETVTWTGSGGGGGGAAISMAANTETPPANSDATLTVSSSGPLASGYQVKIEDPNNGYVYNTCSSSDLTGGTCTLTVPYTDFGGNTGCPGQGESGQSCSYDAYEVPIGDSNATDAIASSGVVTITWQ